MCTHGTHVYRCNRCSLDLRTTKSVVRCDEETPVAIVVDWKCCEACYKGHPTQLKKARRQVASRYESPPSAKAGCSVMAEMISVQAIGTSQKQGEIRVKGSDDGDFVFVDVLEAEDQEYVLV
ncbi:hypothetical protein DL546_002724 [Coniochaeta pulveracea]|uniref:Uncharacterized protein n=1 Tax=Coniochaeta pulveracea TaxID=177199 RepID=A0A420Y657_9PEZI|nr:hypothetical protein DL546_002724 [Coniochaeta pulveracea]